MAQSLPQDKVWEAYNIPQEQGEFMCEFEIQCFQHDGPLDGVFLGNFNYDIERSVQTYTVPVYGLTQGEKIELNIRNYEDEDSKCMNALAHAGHGFVEGCSTNANGTEPAVCSNSITFTQDASKYRGHTFKPGI